MPSSATASGSLSSAAVGRAAVAGEPALPGARHGVGVPAGPAVKTIAVAGTSVAAATARRPCTMREYPLATPISLVTQATPPT